MTMPPDTPPAPVGWHVLGDQITEDTELGTGLTGLQRIYKVPYQIDAGPAKGHVGIVRVRPEEYTPGNLAALIHSAVTNTHNVASLAGQGA